MEQSTDVERDEPVSPVGRFLLQPLTNLDIYIAIAGEYPIDVDAFKNLIKSSIILQLPRFCSLIVRDSCGREHWRKTQVDIDRHIIIRRHPISDDISDEDAVNDYISNLISVSKPLPTDKPLWEFHMLMAHKTIVLRVHHALGDATSLMSMLQSMCVRVEGPVVEPPSLAAAKRRRSSVWKVVRLVWYTLVFCFEYLLRVLWIKDKTTAVSGGYGVELWPRQLATARFRLDDMQTVKRAVADAVSFSWILN
ncbi:hypothetical protein BUALT_Bualt11G0011300 [Buddleja alternifolia]|uniref:diacylglycerol O-acyltransferase n=1 Tax=Buddleja alternifolia TaxID=168488 RepID=A0AAV6WQM6_9LAMI|nr:hypothetical protein BUALT_Bualt11G0011300 [Buddleja alternifolia]